MRRLRRHLALPALAVALVLLACGMLLLVDPGFFWKDDYQDSQLAGYRDAVRAWRAGELPLLSPSSWQAGALAGEYQNAVFSPAVMGPFLVLFELGLPLRTVATLFAVGNLAILGAGCCVLARSRRLSPEGSLLAVVIGTLNGYQVAWGAMCWMPQLVSFAWVPWAWWALERAVRRPTPTAFVLPGVFLALLLLAGCPYSVVVLAPVTAMIALRQVVLHRRWRPLLGVIGAWAFGIGLSAPAWLALVEYNRGTVRGQTPFWAIQTDWLLAGRSLPAVFLPVYRTALDAYVGLSSRFTPELIGGLVPLVILAAGRVTWGNWRPLGRYRWEAALAAVAVAAAMLPSVGPFRWSFRWLGLVYLAGGIAAGAALDRLRRNSPSTMPNLGIWGAAGVALAWGAAIVSRRDPTFYTPIFGIVTLAICGVWTILERGPVRRWASVGAAWVTGVLFLGCVPALGEVPVWDFRQEDLAALPLRPGVRYFGVCTWDDMVEEDFSSVTHIRRGRGIGLMPASLGMYHGGEFVEGYSPMGPRGPSVLLGFLTHGDVDPASAERVLRSEIGPGGLLDWMAVDGLLLPEGKGPADSALVAKGWLLGEETSPQVRTFHRQGAPTPRVRALASAEISGDADAVLRQLIQHPDGPAPRVVFRPGASLDFETQVFTVPELAAFAESRNGATVQVRSTGNSESLIAFSRPWHPGYRAWLDGRPVPVEVLGLLVPVVRLPAGASGRLVLEYRPRAIEWGPWILVGTLAVTAMVFVVTRRRALLTKTACSAANSRT
jgi:hypothetical protein